MKTPRLSRYTILFEKEGHHLLYTSKRNNFYELDEPTYRFLSSLDKDEEEDVDIKVGQDSPIIIDQAATNFDDETEAFLSDLHKKGILATEEEDQAYLENLEILSRMSSFNSSLINLTILPTISCNLRCPYCFEENKPAGKMSKETADKLIEFIKAHNTAKNLSICWFGGEPLLGINIMEYLLPKLSKLEGIKLTGHSIISNGTLISDRVLNLFKDYPLDSIQITLDGNQESHDKKRIYPNGTGSFNQIISNAKKLASVLPDTRISFRVNVDNSNSSEYFDVYKLLSDEFEGARVGIYPGILRANRGCESEVFFSTRDHVDFYRKLRNNGIPGNTYPVCSDRGCTATGISSYVIGPEGEIYKCWEHVGKKERIVGNINGEQSADNGLLRRFLLDGTGFTDSKCRECPLLPICSGGCPNRRIMNIMEGADNELCSIYNNDNRDALFTLLMDYYGAYRNSIKVP